MYRSYSVNNMPEPIMEAKPIPQSSPPSQISTQKEKPAEPAGLKSDDLILILVVLMLLLNECDDKLLLLALAYVFFSEYFG